MKPKQITLRIKLLLTGIITFFVFAILLWEHFNGGVPSHHMLHQKELLAISNWWSGLLLPVLSWVLLSRIEKRFNKRDNLTNKAKSINTKPLPIFITGLLFAIIIAVSFENKFTFLLDNVFFIFFMLSLIIPIFYSEFILGFVLGMTFTFGAFLPTVFILVMAVLGFITYKFIRPLILKLITLLRKQTIQKPKY